VVVARRETSVEISARSTVSFGSDELLGSFYDVSYSYRFGPPSHDLAIATLYDQDREILSESFHFISQRDPVMLPSIKLEAEAELINGEQYRVTLISDKFLQAVYLQAKGFLPTDNYFHMVPGRKKIVLFLPIESQPTSFEVLFEALNLPQIEKIC
jgi:beta-mannosidase